MKLEQHKVFKIFLPNQEDKVIMYDPTIILSDLLAQVDQQKNISDYLPYDSRGKLISNMEITLSKLKSPTVFYVPKGESPTKYFRVLNQTIPLVRAETINKFSTSTSATPSTTTSNNTSPSHYLAQKRSRRKSAPVRSSKIMENKQTEIEIPQEMEPEPVEHVEQVEHMAEQQNINLTNF